MSDTLRQSRQGFGRILIATVVIVAAIGIAIAIGAFWGGEQSNQPSPGAEASQQTKQDSRALEQAVKDLQLSRQQMANQLEEIKRQLATEQGERKMLSEQVGALAGRVDSLATSAAASGGASSKKKR